MKLRVGDLTADSLSNLLDQDTKTGDFSNVISKSNVAEQDLLVDIFDVSPLIREVQGFRKSAIMHQILRSLPQPADSLRRMLSLVIIRDLSCRKIFAEIVGHDLLRQVASAKTRFHLIA